MFALENGSEVLSRRFADVSLDRYDDSLMVSDAEALVAYVFSMIGPASPLIGGRDAFRRFVQHRLASGPLRVAKDVGLFTATRR